MSQFGRGPFLGLNARGPYTLWVTFFEGNGCKLREACSKTTMEGGFQAIGYLP